MSTPADAPRLPEVQARDRRVVWVNLAVSLALIVFGVAYLATHVHHALNGLVGVPIVFGLVRLVWALRMLGGCAVAEHAEVAAALRLVLEGVTAAPDVEADEVHVAYLRGAADALEQVAASR